MSAVSGPELTQRSALKAGISPAALTAPAPIATPRSTNGKLAFMHLLPPRRCGSHHHPEAEGLVPAGQPLIAGHLDQQSIRVGRSLSGDDHRVLALVTRIILRVQVFEA